MLRLWKTTTSVFSLCLLSFTVIRYKIASMNIVIYVTFLLKLLLTPTANAASSCPATQYSGKFTAKEYVENKAIIGHSYKNLTVMYAQECFSHCVSDCKCLSYQIFSGTRCELVNEDQDTTTIKAAMLYMHYPLKQHFKASSGGSCTLKCRNGCCQGSPCMNGGTCVETCKNVKQKFKCICPFGIGGKYCQFIMSCAGIPGNPKSGIHTITRPSLTSQFKVYCDFTSESNYIWTLVESFAYSKEKDYLNRNFDGNHPVNESSPNWIDYRLSLDDMTHVRTNATHWRATCNFHSANISTTDYVRVKMKQVDILQPIPSTCFKNFSFLRLQGTTCNENCVTRFRTKGYHPYFTPCHDANCKFEGCSSGHSYEAFGAYTTVHHSHQCSSSSTSTTNWWIGYKLTSIL